MDATAVFKLSYGLFFLGTEHQGVSNICVVNTVAQITQEPLKLSVTVMKGGYTHELIKKSGKFSVGVMDESVSLSDVAHFGQTTGRAGDKLAGYEVKTDLLGCALYDAGCCASCCCKVTGEVDAGTHTIFLAELIDAKNLSSLPPLTYAAYREFKSGKRIFADKSAPDVSAQDTSAKETWQCTICHYVYDGDIPFEDLPDDYVCPVCKRPKSVFVRV